MTTITDTTLTISRIIQASPERVFEAWTNPEIMAKWSAPEGVDQIECNSNFHVGGQYQIKMINPEGRVHTAVGSYLQIQRPNKLVYTWDWLEDQLRMNIDTVITVEFNPIGETTEVILTHDLFPNREMAEGHNQGWSSSLNRLERLFQ
jgi:uncharacterized protein YndB with AHSA1/START domain